MSSQWTKPKEWSGEGWARDPYEPVTVGDLINWLVDLPPETKIVLSRDAEGNDFKPVLLVTKNYSKVEITKGWAQVEPDDYENGEKVVTLWPYD